MTTQVEAQLIAMRLIMSNVVARIAGANPHGALPVLREMADQCKLAAEHMSLGPDQGTLVQDTQRHLDEFFKGITIT